jgi:hypothetical protein
MTGYLIGRGGQSAKLSLEQVERQFVAATIYQLSAKWFATITTAIQGL